MGRCPLPLCLYLTLDVVVLFGERPPPLCLFLTLGEYNPVRGVNYLLAVGCEHTGCKSLMAGLATEWIYDAFVV
jgi:predicted ABC-type sugar transport system permease subunit